MRKILIAGLGSGKRDNNGEYKKANYSIETAEGLEIYKDESFVTAAIEKHFNIDKTIYIGTAGTMWENLYQYYCKKFNITIDEDDLLELYEITSTADQKTSYNAIDIDKFNKNFNDKVEIILTNYGMNKNEIFENFNLIMSIGEKLENEDEIYLDITHSFRSNAFWMFLVINYIKDVLDKDVKIKMISYGMFEASYKETKNNEAITVAPIVDLTAFYELMEWIKAINAFKEYGNSYEISKLLNNTEINKKIKAFSDGLNLNYLATIKRNITSMKKIIVEFEKLDGPSKSILPRVIKEFIDVFDNIEKDYEFLFGLAEWNYKQKRYAMVAININEGIRELIANLLGIEDRGDDFNNEKSKISKVLKKMRKEAIYKKGNLGKGTFDKKEDKIYNIFETTRKMRNEVAHSIGDKDTAINDVESLRGYIESLKNIIGDKNFIKYLEEKYGE